MTDRPVVVVVGSTMMDMVAYADPLPGAGETVVGSRFALGFGGKGANQAVMAARLGADVVFVNCVGEDVFGDLTVENLAGHGVDTTHVRRSAGASTGAAPIWVESDGTNRIIVVPGANGDLDAAAVREALSSVGRADCVLCQLEVPLAAVEEALRFGRSWGCPTVLNPAPAAPLPEDVVALVDWLVPNESEFATLFGASPDDEGSLLAARDHGLVVTLGAAGAVATVRGRVVRVDPVQVTAVDTTGAGDAFVGGFSYALAAGCDEATALATATACGALSVTGYGTQSALPDRQAVDALLAG